MKQPALNPLHPGGSLTAVSLDGARERAGIRGRSEGDGGGSEGGGEGGGRGNRADRYLESHQLRFDLRPHLLRRRDGFARQLKLGVARTHSRRQGRQRRPVRRLRRLRRLRRQEGLGVRWCGERMRMRRREVAGHPSGALRHEAIECCQRLRHVRLQCLRTLRTSRGAQRRRRLRRCRLCRRLRRCRLCRRLRRCRLCRRLRRCRLCRRLRRLDDSRGVPVVRFLGVCVSLGRLG
jgi:hypothetical protein